MKEYIEREALMKRMEERLASLRKEYGNYDHYTDGFEEGCVAVEYADAADVVEVFRGENSVLMELEEDYKDFEKIRTHLAQIIVEGKVEMPYYSILWFDEETKEYNVGYSSYCLDYVRKWLELVFEVVDATPDVVERKRGDWIPYSLELQTVGFGANSYTITVPTSYECSLCGRVSEVKEPFCHCGADMRSHQNILCDQTEEVEHD